MFRRPGAPFLSGCAKPIACWPKAIFRRDRPQPPWRSGNRSIPCLESVTKPRRKPRVKSWVCCSSAKQLGVLGNLLGHPDYHRRGIGRALLQHCVEHLRPRRVRCLQLHATPLGKKVYHRRGFKQEWTLTRWIKTEAPPRPPPADGTV